MSNYTDNLEYSLSKRIPDMEQGFAIQTNYGEVWIEEDDAEPIITLVKAALERNLVFQKEVERMSKLFLKMEKKEAA